MSRARVLLAWLPAAALLWWSPAALTAEGSDASTTLLTAEQIAAENPADLLALLRGRAGIDYSAGQLTMRGVNGIAIYVDGFPSSSGELLLLKPQQLARIEILRGAASARFGADAMGGAIVVTTRQRVTSSEAEIRQTLKSNGSSATRLSGSHREGALTLSGLAEYAERHGHRAVPKAPFPGQITVEAEQGRSLDADLKLGYQGEQFESDLNLKVVDTRDRLGRPHWWWNQQEQTARLTTRTALAAPWEIKLSLGYRTLDDDALRDPGTGTAPIDLQPDRFIHTDQRGWDAALTASRELAAGTLELAVSGQQLTTDDRIVAHATGATDFRLHARTLNTALRGQYLWRPTETLELELGGGYDQFHYDDTTIEERGQPAPLRGSPLTKSVFNPRLGLRWQANAETTWSSHLGTGFVPPDPGQLYYEDRSAGASFLANPQLAPQRSWTWDLGVTHSSGGDRLGLNLFLTHWENKIGVLIVDYGDPVVRQWNNIGSARAAGVELDWERRLSEAWRLSLNYTWNRTEITRHQADPTLEGNQLPYMPPHKANLALAWSDADWSGRAALRYTGEAYSDERNTVTDAAGYEWRQPAYGVVDLTAERAVGGAHLTLAVENLLDERYRSGFFRESEGRVVRAELAWRF